MTAQEFLSGTTEIVFLLLAALVLIGFARQRSRTRLNAALFFGIIALVLLSGDAADLLGRPDAREVAVISYIGITALAYVLLRLVDDFEPQPVWLMAGTAVLLVGISVVGIVVPEPWILPAALLPITYFAAVGGYAIVRFVRQAYVAAGVTRRRMQAVALGSAGLVAIMVLTVLTLVQPALDMAVSLVIQLLALGSGFAYLAGFAPPPFLRRAWQEPALRALMDDGAEMARLEDRDAIVRSLEETAAELTGARGAAIGLWEPELGIIRYRQRDGTLSDIEPDAYIAGRAFASGTPILSTDGDRDDPEHAGDYRRTGARAVLAAPISAGDRKLGVLAVYAERASIFADEDLQIVRLVAEQAAIVLQSHDLLREAASARAREESARQKDDFLSAVAHDLRTPVTTVLLGSELLARRLRGEGITEGTLERVTVIGREARRLKRLVDDYLDLSQAEEGRLVRGREPGDFADIVRRSLASYERERPRIDVTGDASVPGHYDDQRVQQLVENLLDNAVKYSPEGGQIRVTLAARGDTAHLEVSDSGIGIPRADLPHLFERFRRGSNVDDRRFSGVGLGLYLCRRIAEEHGGGITADSDVGRGTTIRVTLDRSADGHGPVA